MKKLIIIALVLLSSLANAATPSKRVTKAFNKLFPGMTNVVWVKETPKIWEVFFKVNGIPMSAEFDEKGNWLLTKIDITEDNMLSSVSDALNAEYQDWKLTKVDRVVSEQRGTEYMAYLRKGRTKIVVSLQNPL